MGTEGAPKTGTKALPPLKTSAIGFPGKLPLGGAWPTEVFQRILWGVSLVGGREGAGWDGAEGEDGLNQGLTELWSWGCSKFG